MVRDTSHIEIVCRIFELLTNVKILGVYALCFVRVAFFVAIKEKPEEYRMLIDSTK